VIVRNVVHSFFRKIQVFPINWCWYISAIELTWSSRIFIPRRRSSKISRMFSTYNFMKKTSVGMQFQGAVPLSKLFASLRYVEIRTTAYKCKNHVQRPLWIDRSKKKLYKKLNRFEKFITSASLLEKWRLLLV